MYSHATWNYWVPNPNLSLCSNEVFLPASCSVTPPGTGEKEWRGLKGGDGHKCSSSSPLPLSKTVFLWGGGFHCYCYSWSSMQPPEGLSYMAQARAKFDSGRSVWLTHSQGTQHHPDLIMKRFLRAFDPKLTFLLFFAFFCSEPHEVMLCGSSGDRSVWWTASTIRRGSWSIMWEQTMSKFERKCRKRLFSQQKV